MGRIYLLLLSVFFFHFSYSQTPDWIWARNSIGYSLPYSVATDNKGNVFMAGFFGDSLLIFPFDTLVNTSVHSMYLVKYDSSGNELWAKTEKGFDNYVEPSSITTDLSGNVYVVGISSTAWINFGDSTYYNNLDVQNIFIVKYDANGNLLWAKVAGGDENENDMANAVVTDAVGNVYITGTFYNTSIVFDSHDSLYSNETNFYNSALFVMKCDGNGNILWIRQAESENSDASNSMTIDNAGDLYITGYAGDSSIFGQLILVNGGLLIAKYDTAGNILWAKSIPNAAYDTGYIYTGSIVSDNSTNIYLSGYFSGQVTFGSITLNTIGAGAEGMYIVKFDSSCNALWAKTPACGSNEGEAVSTDIFGNVYVVGEYGNTPLCFDNATVLDSGWAMFIVSYDPIGNVRWAKGVRGIEGRGGEATLAYAVNGDNVGNIYVGALTLCSLIIFGQDTLYNNDGWNSILAKINNAIVPPMAQFLALDTSLCANTCINFTNLSTNATSWLWSFAGALDSTSTTENPQNICYSKAGIYNVTLIASNAAGSDTVTFSNYITVNAAPPTPVITQVHDTLFCSTNASYITYQWYLDSTMITSATDSFLVISKGGNYNVEVTNANNCNAAVGINIVYGIQNYVSDNVISIYPNPVEKEFTIHDPRFTIAQVEIYNVLGQETSPPTPLQRRGESAVLDVSGLCSGIYFVRVVSESGIWLGRFVKE